mmetsp:Transcript_11758/g.21401  ORF Transcript_11758/g.21401 Transcript_11758/m.21401 type:complete len:239 (+) Transcript_11758:93-809(+)
MGQVNCCCEEDNGGIKMVGVVGGTNAANTQQPEVILLSEAAQSPEMPVEQREEKDVYVDDPFMAVGEKADVPAPLPMDDSLPPPPPEEKMAYGGVSPQPLCILSGVEEKESDDKQAESLEDGKSEPEPEAKEEDISLVSRIVYITLEKDSQKQRLGLDVKHLGKELEIHDIFNDGCVAMHNFRLEGRGQEEDLVKLRDRIVQVNEVSGSDDAMIRECCESKVMRLKIARPVMQAEAGA